MSIKEYALKFHQLSRYAPNLVVDMRVRMKKFTSRLSRDPILESKAALLIKDMDISRLVVHMQEVEDGKQETGRVWGKVG